VKSRTGSTSVKNLFFLNYLFPESFVDGAKNGARQRKLVSMLLDAAATPAANALETPGKMALVIPTYHEAGNILALLSRLGKVLDPIGIPYEILIVDDDSRDRIVDLVSAVSESDPRVRLLVRKGERGLSGAILYGWQHTGAEILGVMDADLQHPPELLPALFHAVLEGRDLVIASRYANGGNIGGWNPGRRLLSSAAISATWPLLHDGLRAQDPTSGFFLVRRRCLDGVEFHKAGFKLLLEILVRGRVRSMQEVPFTFGHRHAGHSKASARVALDYAALLAQLYRERLWTRRSSPTTAAS
jgi:dolichol-phosphate mannosyltransferase